MANLELVNVRIPKSQRNALDRIANKTLSNRSQAARMALDAGLKTLDREYVKARNQKA